MAPKPTGPRHLRVGPCIDVAACGARGDGTRFVLVLNQATCEACVAKRVRGPEARAAFAKKMRFNADARRRLGLAGGSMEG